MAFNKKTWVNRVVQYPLRRLLTVVRDFDTSDTAVMDIEREEGTITTEGDAFSAANMNDLEQRIAEAFEDTGGGNFVGTQAEWNALTAAEKAKFDKSTGATVNITDDDIPDDIIGTEDISGIADGTLTGVAVKHEEDIADLNSALDKFKTQLIDIHIGNVAAGGANSGTYNLSSLGITKILAITTITSNSHCVISVKDPISTSTLAYTYKNTASSAVDLSCKFLIYYA